MTSRVPLSLPSSMDRMKGVPEFLEQEALAAAPLGVEPHGDGHGERGLRQDVRQGAAIQVVT